jgi:hypothetical protein
MSATLLGIALIALVAPFVLKGMSRFRASPTIFDIGVRSGGFSIGGVPMVVQGRYTPAGWYHMLTIMLLDFVLGAIGGLIGWLIAAGFRLRIR